MTDRQQELLIEMILKINEAKTYNRVSGILMILWLFEFCYTLFWTKNFSAVMYWLVWIVCIIGWTHMNRKFKNSVKEYDQLKEEYENSIDGNV